MKKLAIIIAIMATVLAAACSACAPQTADSSAPLPAQTPQAATQTPAPVAAVTHTTMSTPEPTSAPTPTPTPTPYTWVWLSDTQYYNESYPEHFLVMCRDIAAKAETENIKLVVHTGDLVNDEDSNKQWLCAGAGLDELAKAGLNVFLVPGNHDVDGDKMEYDSWRTIFSANAYKNYPEFGGDYEAGLGRYDLLDIDGVPAIIAYMGWKASDKSALKWLDGVLKEHSDRLAVLCFHGYMRTNGELLNEGEKYLSVIEQNPNVRLVLCGHKHGVFRQIRTFDDDGDGSPDRLVHELISDYQSEPEGGLGYYSLMRFNMEKGEVSVTAYSPLMDDYNLFDDAAGLETFTIQLDLD